jgi:hypothetical protein
MKLIIPTTIGDTSLIYSNVHETIDNEWDGVTTYGKAECDYTELRFYVEDDYWEVDENYVHVETGTQRDVYESLQDSNLNNDPTTETDWWAYRSTTYEEYAAGTTYADGDKVVDATNHLIYESLQNANTGHALTDTTWWLKIGSTNPWRVFDAKVGSQTERTGSIYYELEPGIIEGIAFFNLDASSINIVFTDPTDGEVYNETINLISTSNVFDGYSYCFAPFLITRATVKTNLPPYGLASLQITIKTELDTETAKCGEIVLGRVLEFGNTQYGAGFEIIDYSRKDVDDFGNFSVVERAFSKRIPIDVSVENAILGYLKQTLEDYRATPVVCIPTEVENLQGPFLIYGYYRTAKTVVPYPNHSILTIEWEGLT